MQSYYINKDLRTDSRNNTNKIMNKPDNETNNNC